MAGYYLTDAEFINEWNIISSPIKFASKHGMDVRSVHNRRRSIEARHNISLPTLKDSRYTAPKKLEQTVEKENKLVDERQNIEIEVSVEVSDDAVELEPDEMNPEMHCPDETMVEELVDIVYNGNTYSIPKSVIEPYLNEVDSAQLEEYFTELDSSVEKLKKECNTQ